RTGRYEMPGPLTATAVTAAGLSTAFRLAAMARRARAELIHTNGMKAHLLGGLAGRLIGVPVVWHLREFPPPGWVGRVFAEAARRLPAGMLANSAAVAAALPSGNGAPVFTLPSPVDLERFRPGLGDDRIRRELGVARDEFLVGLVAHLTPWKGHM